MKNFNSYETDRLILRPTNVEDGPFLLELMNSEKWKKYIGDRQIASVSDAENYVRSKMLPQLNRLGYGNFTLITKDKNEKIGTCGLYDRDGLEGLDIGFALLQAYERKGFAFEAANKLKKLSFNQFGVTQLSAICLKENQASINLIQRLGLKLLGPITLNGSNEELLHYKITKSEFDLEN